jgi:DNA repair protein RecN (Recombination protein N)
MLSHIHISNFAIVDELELDFSPGMSTLTGETGAGKSIVVDALGFALGDRADSGFVRHGAERAEISVTFDVRHNEPVQNWLVQQDIDNDDDCLLRRVIGSDGRSRAYINGSQVPVQTLKQLGDMLVDIHGQHEHQSLLKPDMQRTLLDSYGQHQEQLAKVQDIYQQWRDAHRELDTLSGSERDHEDRLELLGYQLDELETLNLQPGEQEQLDQEHARLANANRLLDTGQQVYQRLSEDESSLLDQLERMVSDVSGLANVDDRFGDIASTLNMAAEQSQDAARSLRQLLENTELDPERLQEVEQRISAIHDLARKHRVPAKELPEVHARIARELDGLKNAEGRIRELQSIIEQTQQDYAQHAAELKQLREKASKRLAKAITQNMHQLGMPGGVLEIRLHDQPLDRLSPAGTEKVEFMVSANPGQPVKPLTKVASGGELSRISLAIQVITAANVQVPTMIFDEVDVGIGGGVAEVVGEQLHALSANTQVICVTHLAQVAAQGDNQYMVSKLASSNVTQTQIRHLSNEERVQEIARMMGGKEITEQTLALAQEMIGHARSSRKNKGKRAG